MISQTGAGGPRASQDKTLATPLKLQKLLSFYA